ncbi:Ferrous iron transport permease EfeU [Streptococcus sp. DD11]|nr:Ferrous iron transport permease EfeU [Streptococcus sp. DD11]
MAFKMLGVSIHALQLTNVLPSHLLNGFPTVDWAGIYPSLEAVISQAVFLLLIVGVTVKNNEKSHE